jgi:ABC-type sugar transport system permease subunit
MYLQAFTIGRMGYASSVGATLFAVILALTIINYRFFRTDSVT